MLVPPGCTVLWLREAEPPQEGTTCSSPRAGRGRLLLATLLLLPLLLQPGTLQLQALQEQAVWMTHLQPNATTTSITRSPEIYQNVFPFLSKLPQLQNLHFLLQTFFFTCHQLQKFRLHLPGVVLHLLEEVFGLVFRKLNYFSQNSKETPFEKRKRHHITALGRKQGTTVNWPFAQS